MLPIALPQRTYAACSPRVDDLLRAHSAQTGETVEVNLDEVGPGTPGGLDGIRRRCDVGTAADGHDVGGLDVAIDSEVPVGGGLSSSAALECSVGAAVSDLGGLGLLGDEAGRARLAAACVRAENDVAGAPTGGMDQSASLLCREDHALLLDCRSGATEHVPLDLVPGSAGSATARATPTARAEPTAAGMSRRTTGPGMPAVTCCSSRTRGPSTPSTTASTPSAARPASARPRSSGSTRFVTSTRTT